MLLAWFAAGFAVSGPAIALSVIWGAFVFAGLLAIPFMVETMWPKPATDRV